MRLFKIVCRGSKLSLAQADIFKKKLMAGQADMKVEIIIKETEGGINQIQPLTELEGKDFFTKDIPDYLLNGHAEFAVHSLKDVSGENFGEYESIELLAKQNSIDRSKGHVEVWTSLKRAGANSIISHASRHAKNWIDKIEY